MKKIYSKKTIIIIAISIGLIIGAFFLINYIIDKLSGNLEAKQNIKSVSQEISKDTSTELKPADYYPESNIYDIMHRMTNSKIIAKDGQIWGTLPMGKEQIQTLKQTIEKINYPDREYLLGALSRWEQGDFSQSVDEHNYLWNKLGGTVGEANKLKK
ncbi:DUF6241 domain-containing protein [Candidatus Clostridium radicumherbarum]|uniref:DUF6241 domain-containing protein n=1 Tax=Candidatus Clostridium radicumherbarum TaxID=3381662 RepID=A0ABW8TVV4_9CLOT